MRSRFPACIPQNEWVRVRGVHNCFTSTHSFCTMHARNLDRVTLPSFIIPYFRSARRRNIFAPFSTSYFFLISWNFWTVYVLPLKYFFLFPAFESSQACSPVFLVKDDGYDRFFFVGPLGRNYYQRKRDRDKKVWLISLGCASQNK